MLKSSWNNHNLKLRRDWKEGWQYFSLLTVAEGLQKPLEMRGCSCRGLNKPPSPVDPPVDPPAAGWAARTQGLGETCPPHFYYWWDCTMQGHFQWKFQSTNPEGTSQAGSAATIFNAVLNPLPQPVAEGSWEHSSAWVGFLSSSAILTWPCLLRTMLFSFPALETNRCAKLSAQVLFSYCKY